MPWGARLYGHDESIISDHLSILHSEENKIYLDAIWRRGKVVDGEDVLPLEEIQQRDVDELYYAKHGIVHCVGFSYEHQKTKTYTNISLNHKDGDRPFEKALVTKLNGLLPGIVEIVKTNLELFFLENTRPRKSSSVAVCTRSGHVLFKDKFFDGLLDIEFPYRKSNLSYTPIWCMRHFPQAASV